MFGRVKKVGRVTTLPPHTPPVNSWSYNVGRRLAPHGGHADSFDYIAPVVKYTPTSFQPGPGPVYNSTEITAIGHQPYNVSNLPLSAVPQPASIHILPKRGYGDAAPLILQSQQMLAMVLASKSGGG